ncbi:MAG: AAA family ATPase [Holosporales bacterium]|jgi:DNA polymerase-3 subunit delta'|nr:AAA family ATPase [Holosporales bacterium]
MSQHPKDASFLIGHQRSLDAIKASLDKPTHSWLFEGRPGIGKATLAYRFIKYLLAKDDSNKNAETLEVPLADSVHKMVSGQVHPDLTVVGSDGAMGEISADQVRKAMLRIYNRPAVSEFNILLIDNAEKLNRNSANMLLKTLEEPPGHAVIILVCNSSNTLPKTIASRCRKVAFSALSQVEVCTILKRLIPGISDEEIADLTTVSNGSVGDAMKLCDLGEAAYSGLEAYKSVLKLLGQKAPLDHFLSELFAQDINAIWPFVRIILPRVFLLPCSWLIGLEQSSIIDVEHVWLKHISQSASMQAVVKSYAKAMSIINDTEALDLDKRASLVMLFAALINLNKSLLTQ